MFVAPRLASDLNGQECDEERGSRIGDCELYFSGRCHTHAQFLTQLTASGGFVGLPRLRFPSGKLPKAPMPLERWALADQELSTASNHSGNYPNRLLSCQRVRT